MVLASLEVKMKKVIIILVGVSTLILTGCKDDRVDRAFIKGGRFGRGYGVIVMEDTGVLYYESGYKLAPYISSNGYYCKYENGEIVEIKGEDENGN